MNAYSHIIWDWNGTLLDDVQLCVDVVNIMLARRGRPGIDLRQYKANFEFPVRNYYERVGFDFSKENYDAACTEFCDEYAQRVCECRLHTGARSILEECAARKYRQLILSVTEQSRLESMVAIFGIAALFDGLIGQADHHATGKAGRARELLAKLGVSGDRVLLIGDTTHDVDVAREIGADCILVAVGHHTHAKLAQTGAPVFDRLAQVGTLLRELTALSGEPHTAATDLP